MEEDVNRHKEGKGEEEQKQQDHKMSITTKSETLAQDN